MLPILHEVGGKYILFICKLGVSIAPIINRQNQMGQLSMDNGTIEYLGGTPVTINATNGAIVNATFVINLEREQGDSLRRWAAALILNEEYGVPVPVEFACERRIK